MPDGARSGTQGGRDAAIEQLRRAILDPGRDPVWHRRTMERHRREWPVLWRAIDRLLREETD
jgi:hypothetical protein